MVQTMPNTNKANKITDLGTGAQHNKEFKPAAGNYTYDPNGNTTFAPHKKATVLYNYLNLPGKITVSGTGGGELNFVYDAAGNKLKKTCGSTTNYYHGNAMKIGGTPIILTGEGRALKDAAGWHYEYDLKDHLGNTRASFAAGLATAAPLQYIDYYPFGLEMASGLPRAAGATRFLYAGKELHAEAGLDSV